MTRLRRAKCPECNAPLALRTTRVAAGEIPETLLCCPACHWQTDVVREAEIEDTEDDVNKDRSEA